MNWAELKKVPKKERSNTEKSRKIVGKVEYIQVQYIQSQYRKSFKSDIAKKPYEITNKDFIISGICDNINQENIMTDQTPGGTNVYEHHRLA